VPHDEKPTGAPREPALLVDRDETGIGKA